MPFSFNWRAHCQTLWCKESAPLTYSLTNCSSSGFLNVFVVLNTQHFQLRIFVRSVPHVFRSLFPSTFRHSYGRQGPVTLYQFIENNFSISCDIKLLFIVLYLVGHGPKLIQCLIGNCFFGLTFSNAEKQEMRSDQKNCRSTYSNFPVTRRIRAAPLEYHAAVRLQESHFNLTWSGFYCSCFVQHLVSEWCFTVMFDRAFHHIP